MEDEVFREFFFGHDAVRHTGDGRDPRCAQIVYIANKDLALGYGANWGGLHSLYSTPIHVRSIAKSDCKILQR